MSIPPPDPAVGRVPQEPPAPCKRCGKTLAQHYGAARCYRDEDVQFIPAAPLVAPALFQLKPTTLHSGERSRWKIDCDALTDGDIATLADLIAERVGPFSAVEGVPNGGLRLAEALRRYQTSHRPLLIVDDVLTTGASLEAQRAGREAIGAVIFARREPPSWVSALFQMPPLVAPAGVPVTLESRDEVVSITYAGTRFIRETQGRLPALEALPEKWRAQIQACYDAKKHNLGPGNRTIIPVPYFSPLDCADQLEAALAGLRADPAPRPEQSQL